MAERRHHGHNHADHHPYPGATVRRRGLGILRPPPLTSDKRHSVCRDVRFAGVPADGAANLLQITRPHGNALAAMAAETSETLAPRTIVRVMGSLLLSRPLQRTEYAAVFVQQAPVRGH